MIWKTHSVCGQRIRDTRDVENAPFRTSRHDTVAESQDEAKLCVMELDDAKLNGIALD
jgi:hypothetical protein